MLQKQITIFIENRSGRLSEVLSAIAAEKINLTALSLADTATFGLLRILADDVDNVAGLLKKHNLALSETQVIPVTVKNEPGAVAAVTAALTEGGFSIEYMYTAMNEQPCAATLVICTDRPAEADAYLAEKGLL